MWKEAAAWMAGLGCACLALSEYEKKHFSVEAVTMGSDKLDPVSYTHLTLPTNREV